MKTKKRKNKKKRNTRKKKDLDFTLLKELLPDQVKECKIIEQNNNETITEELLKFNTYFGDKKMTQRTSHKIINPDVIVNQTIDGPFNDSKLTITLDENDDSTQITLDGECKIPLKYALLSPVIKKKYKGFCIAMLYKINNKYNVE